MGTIITILIESPKLNTDVVVSVITERPEAFLGEGFAWHYLPYEIVHKAPGNNAVLILLSLMESK